MRRREFIALLGGTAAAWPFGARAQPLGKVYRIAIVTPALPITTLTETGRYFRPTFEELRRAGYVEGQNLVVERYSGQKQTDRYPEMVRDVVQSQPDVIVCMSSRLTQYFKAATSTIPIVALTSDPLAWGIVANLARPGGNITGVAADAGIGLDGKRLELLREAVPRMSKVGYLAPRVLWDGLLGVALRDAAQRMGTPVFGAVLDSPIQEPEYRRAFAAMAQERVEALIVGEAGEIYATPELIIELAEKSRSPTIYPNRVFVELGGLMSYGIDMNQQFREAGATVV